MLGEERGGTCGDKAGLKSSVHLPLHWHGEPSADTQQPTTEQTKMTQPSDVAIALEVSHRQESGRQIMTTLSTLSVLIAAMASVKCVLQET